MLKIKWRIKDTWVVSLMGLSMVVMNLMKFHRWETILLSFIIPFKGVLVGNWADLPPPGHEN